MRLTASWLPDAKRTKLNAYRFAYKQTFIYICIVIRNGVELKKDIR